jgi:tetratricopeptide (TPR) repeat protein
MNQRKFLLLLATILAFLRLDASIIDSLEQVLPDTRGKERVDVLTKLARLNFRVDQQKALDYGSEALRLAEKINYKEGMADALLHMSTAYYYLSSYNQAIEYLKQTLEIREKLNDTTMITDALNKIAINHRMIGNLEESLQFSFQALRIHELREDSVNIAALLNNIGGIYRSLTNYSKALEYYSESYQLYLSLQLESGIAHVTNNLGIIYRFQGEYDKALDFYEKSLKIDEKLGNQREVAQSLNNIGNLYSIIGNHDKAVESFNNALNIAKQINNLETQSVSLTFLGDVYFANNQPNQARNSYIEALKRVEQTGNIDRKSTILQKLADISAIMQNYEQATQYYESLLEIRDTLHNAKMRAVIAETEAKYEFEKKAREIESLRQENRIQELKLNENRIITYSLAGISFTILIIALLLIQRGRIYAIKRNAELEQKLFRTQMNPHFIFNALNAIQSFIYKNEPAEAGKYLSNFARLIRLVLNNSREDFIPLDSEIRTLDYYLQLQRLRFNNKFDFTIKIDPAIHRELIMVPPMLAQPFIENSIEHGIQHLASKGNIAISFNLTNGWLYFNVEDNGIGISQTKINSSEQYNRHESLALSITEERLKLLNKSKQQKIELSIVELTSENHETRGTSITFNIPFIKINDKRTV